MKESKLEKKVCDYAESKGWGNVKTYSKGYPDRVFYKDGKAFFIEFKTKKGVVSEAQKHIMKKLCIRYGMYCYLVDDYDYAVKIFDNHNKFSR